MRVFTPIAWLPALLLLCLSFTTATAQTNSLIRDSNLEAVVRLALQKPTGPITESDLLGLTQLGAPNYQISSLEGLEFATHLQVLQLSANQITNIAPLNGLPELADLDLSFNPVNDWSPLLSLSHLDFLQLMGTQLKQVGFLTRLPALTGLDLGYNHITDFTPLETLTNLTFLNLGGNPTADLTPLNMLSGLRNVSLYDLGLTNATFLATLTNLHHLDLSRNQISELTPLLKLTAIQDLDLSLNPVTSLGALAGLTNLSRLVLGQIGLTNLAPLAGFYQLTDLELENNQLLDMSPLAGMTNLVRLDLGFNSITNYSGLEKLTNLTELHLEANGITHLSFLRAIPWLTVLGLTFNQISDLTPLNSLTNLQRLDLAYNLLSDVSALASLTNLTQVVLNENLLNLTDGSSATLIIQALQNRGVAVYYQPQSEPPTILVRSNWLISANQRSPISFQLIFPASPAGVPTCSAFSSNPALIPNTNLVLSASPGALTWTVSVTPLKDQTGGADLVLYATNTSGLWTNVSIHVEVANPVPFDGQQLDSPALIWSSAGEPPWLNQSVVSHDGFGAAESGATNSWVQTKVTGPGTLSFWWRLTSDAPYEHGQFTAVAQDRELQATHDLYETDPWQQAVIGLPAGDWVLKWSPAWDNWYNYGSSNALWLDQVSFVPGVFVPRLELAPSWDHSPDGSFWVDVTGEEGQSYAIEVSTDLLLWSPLTRVSCVNFQAQFSDRNSGAAARFYRARRVP